MPRPLASPRAAAPGAVRRFFLTFRTDRRRHLFTKAEVVALALSQISRCAAEERLAIVAYCFMPDHVHLLVEGRSPAADCPRFVARAKQLSAFHYSRLFGGRLWQRAGFARTLGDDEPIEAVARRILENPVRAGLARTPRAYPYLGSKVYPLDTLLS